MDIVGQSHVQTPANKYDEDREDHEGQAALEAMAERALSKTKTQKNTANRNQNVCPAAVSIMSRKFI